MKHKLTYYYRKTHRYLGVIIGVQFIFWTLGGLFFSWSDMDQIHGDTNRKETKLIADFNSWLSLSVLMDNNEQLKIDSLISFKVINFLNMPFYQIRYFSGDSSKVLLANVKTGELKYGISKEEAILLANEVFVPKTKIKNVDYITEENVSMHHEYRGRPLPAYAIEFEHKSGTVVYISKEYGQVMTFRNTNWRIFDFLWMMHTMDFKGRDNIGNTLLRVFSVLGLITIVSGFLLYFKTS